MSCAHDPTPSINSAPFEGPEKLLEIWFAPNVADLPDATSTATNRLGLRKVERSVWEDMLSIVRCKVLSFVEGTEIDAYLLSESSLFVSAHRLILKTCGTTLNLLGLPRILEIARDHASLPSVHRCFYSHKAFMFPERQSGPHRDWNEEIKYLDSIFRTGSAYTVGKVNGDHWLLYLTNPEDGCLPNSPITACVTDRPFSPVLVTPQDYTVEILMSDLSAKARKPFFCSPTPGTADSHADHARSLSSAVGITEIFPPHMTILDAYSFTPCGYSANALIRWTENHTGDPREPQIHEGYYNIHVTPENGWSYASFECNVPISNSPSANTRDELPDLTTLVRRVVDIFQPGRLSLTLFISSTNINNDDDGRTGADAVQRAFKSALTMAATSRDPAQKILLYKRTDKINYEFGGYDLAFASFEVHP